jgi:hypothetical protein
MKRDILRLYGIGAVIACIAFSMSLGLEHSASSPFRHGRPLDWAVLSLAIWVIGQSMLALAVNNFIFLGASKDWRDFWKSDMLEYFRAVEIHEKWRIARGRIILYFAGFVSGFVLFFLYGQVTA